LQNDDRLDAATLKSPPDAHALTTAGMEAISDPAFFSRMFVGSVSPFRATPG